MTGKPTDELDFPWASLGEALVVDVGGGVGECPILYSAPKAKVPSQVNSRFNELAGNNCMQ
jgi:hypothetical protein